MPRWYLNFSKFKPKSVLPPSPIQRLPQTGILLPLMGGSLLSALQLWTQPPLPHIQSVTGQMTLVPPESSLQLPLSCLFPLLQP